MDCCAKLVILLLAVVASARSRGIPCPETCTDEERPDAARAQQDTVLSASSLNHVRGDGTVGDGGYVNLGVGDDGQEYKGTGAYLLDVHENRQAMNGYYFPENSFLAAPPLTGFRGFIPPGEPLRAQQPETRMRPDGLYTSILGKVGPPAIPVGAGIPRLMGERPLGAPKSQIAGDLPKPNSAGKKPLGTLSGEIRKVETNQGTGGLLTRKGGELISPKPLPGPVGKVTDAKTSGIVNSFGPLSELIKKGSERLKGLFGNRGGGLDALKDLIGKGVGRPVEISVKEPVKKDSVPPEGAPRDGRGALRGVLGKLKGGQWGLYFGNVLMEAVGTFIKGAQNVLASQVKTDTV